MKKGNAQKNINDSLSTVHSVLQSCVN